MISKPWLPRIAAQPTLFSTQSAETPADPARSTAILSALNTDGAVYLLGDYQHQDSGYFKVVSTTGAGDFFVKFVGNDQVDRQVMANDVARYLLSNDVSVSCMEDGFPKQADDGRWMLAYPYVDSRPIASEGQPSLAPDYERLGSAIGKLHQALLLWPDTTDVQYRTATRHTMLNDRLHNVLGGSAVPGPVAGLVRDMAGKYPDAFTSPGADAQMIHGDLNFGNVLFDEIGNPVFLDFEESVGAWYPRRIDVIYVLERFVWAKLEDDDAAIDMARRFIAAYHAVSGAAILHQSDQLRETVDWLALRSFLLMTESAEQGTVWPETEWRKFETLLAIADDRTDLLLEIENLLLNPESCFVQ